MALVQHISMRVPWRDQPWNDKVCSNPIDNSSCLLLKNIGDNRDDAWEDEHAGTSFAELAAPDRLPCLSERGTFMSKHGYALIKEHPYRFSQALKGHLNPTTVSVPGYSFEAVPFRWLSRDVVEDELWLETDRYRPEREDHTHKVLGFKSGWLMDGRNQRALIDRFFADVTPGHSLVLVYLKHSPLQEGSMRRLLVGAATVSSITPPPMWNQSGGQPFDSSMWETIIGHSLRPDQGQGILLPYQDLISLLGSGVDVAKALAWAPEDADVEFSYVTEHVSDDTTIAALNSLRAAADGMRDLGVEVPASAIDWVDEAIERIWQLRGPAPGMSAVLSYLGVESAHVVTRRLIAEPDWDTAPWEVVDRAFDGASSLGNELAATLPPSVGHTWNGLSADEQTALRLLSAMDLHRDQVTSLMDGHTTWEVTPAELIANPYYAATCTHRSEHPISLHTVDQASFPAGHVKWQNLIQPISELSDPGDPRRIEAFMVDVLEAMAADGDTLAVEDEVIAAAAAITTTRPCPISRALLKTYGLNAGSLDDYSPWTPLTSAELEGGEPAYKLLHLQEVGSDIADHMIERRQAKRFSVPFDPRAAIDHAFGVADPGDEEEELARSEKAEGLGELYASRLSVLLGPAGTGKTSLLQTLVAQPDIQQGGVLLLAPTGKARVQLQSKVNFEAQTLASFLVKRGGFHPVTGQYMTVDSAKRLRVGLVVIDEASMLTEEMLAATLSGLEGVKRLILVGDHRQLPPIGAGRPFVDLVEWLKPTEFSGATRVSPGFVELTVFRRQKGADRARDDLELARWFGGEDLAGAADEVWQKLRLGTATDTLSCRQWTADGVVPTLVQAMEDELGLNGSDDPERAFKLTYGAQLSDDGQWVNWRTGAGGAGEHCEDWQVLSPTRSRAFGTVELNRTIKQRYRTGDLRRAEKFYGHRPPKPLGPEQIVVGDKVMQTRNDSRAKAYPDGAGMNYVANGEIGVVVGRETRSPTYANVEFSSQVGATYGYWPSSSDDPPLELAWAVTVHKSQGSEFGVTFLVLPTGVAVSRELLYTALTRQTRKVVILHEGSVDSLFELASPALSETARRLTDLFRKPAPRALNVGDSMRRFDANLIHVAPGGVLVRSKNEVIVASILQNLVPDRWSYERPLKIDGVTKYPDFVIETSAGDEVIWEHLGMMSNPKYAADWATKKAWYIAQGYRPYDEPDTKGDRGVLMWSNDSNGVDQPAWEAMAEKVLGSTVSSRRATKKASARRV